MGRQPSRAEVRVVPITRAQRDMLGKGSEFVPLLGKLAEVWDASPSFPGLYAKCFLRLRGCTVAEDGVAPGYTSCQHCLDVKRASELDARPHTL